MVTLAALSDATRSGVEHVEAGACRADPSRGCNGVRRDVHTVDESRRVGPAKTKSPCPHVKFHAQSSLDAYPARVATLIDTRRDDLKWRVETMMSAGDS